MATQHPNAGEPLPDLRQVHAHGLVISCEVIDDPLPGRAVLHVRGGGVVVGGKGFLDGCVGVWCGVTEATRLTEWRVESGAVGGWA